MAVESARHPENDQLVAFGLGNLGPSEAAQIADHLDHCRSCAETIINLQDDTFVGLVRQAPAAPTPAALLAEVLDAPQATIDGASGHADVGGELTELPPELRDHPRYEIMGVIGRGGMGDVYKAQHKLMNRPVALKVIKPGLVQNEAAVQRFHREVQAAARLHHPNIVTSYDAEQIGSFHFLVMEFVEGVDLDEVVAAKGRLPLLDACAYIRQAAEGLQYAYEQGMVHRDIKPHNLMVGRDGGMKILDFGLASLTAGILDEDFVDLAEGRAEEEPPQLTVSGTTMGTPDYIAPEQARDAHTADIRADIYSLGCTFYTLLAGRPPFNVGSPTDRISAHAEQTAPPLSLFRDDVPADVEAILRQMIAKEPAERYQKPADVAAALEPVLRPAAAPVQRPALKPATQPRRGRRPILMLTAIAALLFALFSAAVVFYVQSDYGVVRVEVADESLNAQLNGQTIEMKDGETPLSIRAGDQKLIVRRGDFEFETREFTLQRGKAVALKVQLLAGDVVVLKDGKLFGEKALPKRQQQAEASKISLVRTFEGHHGPASGLAVSADGRLALSGSGFPSELGDKTVRLWETSSGKALWIKTIPFNIRSVALSPDGKLAAAGGEGDKIWLWTTGDGKEAISFQGHKAAVESLAFSRDGRLLLSGHGNGVVVLYDVVEQKELQRFTGHPNQVKGLAFLLDGQHVVSAGFFDKAIRVWDIATGKEITRFESATEIVQTLAVSPDGTRLVSGGAGGIQAWDVKSGKEVWRVSKRPECRIVHVAFLPDGNHVISGDSDANLDVWRINEKTPVASVHQPSGVVWGLGVVDGRHVLSSGGTTYRQGSGFRHPSGDYSLRLWRLPMNVQTSESWQLPERVGPKGHSLLQPVRQFKAHTAPVFEVAFTPDGKRAISVSDDCTACFWDLEAGKRLLQSRESGCHMRGIGVSPDGRYAITTGLSIALWDLAEIQFVRTLAEGGVTHSPAFSSDGKFMATGSSDGKLRVWETETWQIAYETSGYSAIFSPDDRLLATRRGNAIALLDAKTGDLIRLLEGQRQPFSLFSPDGRLVANGSSDGSVFLYEVQTGKRLQAWKYTGRAAPVAFLADGERLLIRTHQPDSLLCVADVNTGEELLRTTSHSGSISHAVVLPGEQRVLSATYDGKLYLWELLKGRELARVDTGGSVTENLALSPDGRHALSAGGYGKAKSQHPQPRPYDVYLWRLTDSAAPTAE